MLHCIGERQITDRAEVQAQLLERIAPWVKPEGILVYAVCSLEPEEGEQQIEKFLKNHNEYEIAPVNEGELPEGIEPTPDGHVRTLPTMLARQRSSRRLFHRPIAPKSLIFHIW